MCFPDLIYYTLCSLSFPTEIHVWTLNMFFASIRAAVSKTIWNLCVFLQTKNWDMGDCIPLKLCLEKDAIFFLPKETREWSFWKSIKRPWIFLGPCFHNVCSLAIIAFIVNSKKSRLLNVSGNIFYAAIKNIWRSNARWQRQTGLSTRWD